MENTMLKRNILAVMLTLALPFTAHAAAETYTIDPLHTFAHFTVSHMGFSTMHGRFDKSSGSIILDLAGKKGSVSAAIETGSVNTGFAKRDEHLKSPDFFNAAEFPTITYKAAVMKFNGEKPSSVEGSLTMNGVTKPVNLTITAFRCDKDPMDPKKFKCGADANAQLKRSDFGMKAFLPGIGDDIKMEFEIEAYRN
jgi:polyisoprenoid-binding protein YceI